MGIAYLEFPHYDPSQHGETVHRLLTEAAALDPSLMVKLKWSEYAFASEIFCVMENTAQHNNAFSRFFEQRVIHPQATLNELAIDIDLQSKIAALPADRMLTDGDTMLENGPEASYGRYCLTETVCLYNLQGHRVSRLSAEKTELFNMENLMKFHDIQAYIRLVNLQFALMQQQPFLADVPVFLAQHPQWFNPYTR